MTIIKVLDIRIIEGYDYCDNKPYWTVIFNTDILGDVTKIYTKYTHIALIKELFEDTHINEI